MQRIINCGSNESSPLTAKTPSALTEHDNFFAPKQQKNLQSSSNQQITTATHMMLACF